MAVLSRVGPRNWRLVTRAALLIAACWTLLVGLGFALDGAWPVGHEAWENFLTLGLIVTFLLGKAALMALRTRVWGSLGASLVAVNLTFAVLYGYGMAATLWAGLRTTAWHPLGWQVRPVDFLRWSLIVTCLWAIWELVRVPDPEDDEDPWAMLEAANDRIADLETEVLLLRGRIEAGY